MTLIRNNGVLSKPPEPNVAIPRISKNELEQTAKLSIQTFQEQKDKITDILFSKNVYIITDSKNFYEIFFFKLAFWWKF